MKQSFGEVEEPQMASPPATPNGFLASSRLRTMRPDRARAPGRVRPPSPSGGLSIFTPKPKLRRKLSVRGSGGLIHQCFHRLRNIETILRGNVLTENASFLPRRIGANPPTAGNIARSARGRQGLSGQGSCALAPALRANSGSPGLSRGWELRRHHPSY